MKQNSQDQFVVAIDLGGTNLRAATVDSAGRIHERTKLPTPKSDNSQDVVDAITSAVLHCEQQAGTSEARASAVSIVVPGSVQAETGIIVNAPNLPAVVDFKLGEALQARLQRPVLIENDANAAAVGEMWQGVACSCQTIVCLTLGTGVGSGIILNGELWRGIDGTAGEIGHTSVEPFGGVQCNCGNFGCLEVYASATAIVRLTREMLDGHLPSILRSSSLEILTAHDVYRAAEAGDKAARDIFYSVGRHLGVALANTVNTLNPEMIVIGGGVSAAFDLFADIAREEMIKRAFPVPARRCQIAKAECGDDAGLLGAAKLAFDAPVK